MTLAAFLSHPVDERHADLIRKALPAAREEMRGKAPAYGLETAARGLAFLNAHAALRKRVTKPIPAWDREPDVLRVDERAALGVAA